MSAKHLVIDPARGRPGRQDGQPEAPAGKTGKHIVRVPRSSAAYEVTLASPVAGLAPRRTWIVRAIGGAAPVVVGRYPTRDLALQAARKAARRAARKSAIVGWYHRQTRSRAVVDLIPSADPRIDYVVNPKVIEGSDFLARARARLAAKPTGFTDDLFAAPRFPAGVAEVLGGD